MPRSYRPIPLFSSLGKVYERLIYKGFQKRLEKENAIISQQFGFTRGESASLELAQVIHLATVNKNINKISQQY